MFSWNLTGTLPVGFEKFISDAVIGDGINLQWTSCIREGIPQLKKKNMYVRKYRQWVVSKVNSTVPNDNRNSQQIILTANPVVIPLIVTVLFEIYYLKSTYVKVLIVEPCSICSTNANWHWDWVPRNWRSNECWQCQFHQPDQSNSNICDNHQQGIALSWDK